jgi:HPt (histidine-containing phosphotransfer) domain-containing protein
MTCPSTDQTDTMTAIGIESSNDQVLDTETLRQLSQMDPSGEHGLIERVLVTYEKALQKAQLELRDAMAANDLDVIKRVAHTLRSSSATVGAVSFSKRCKLVESAIRDGCLDDLPSSLQLLDQESREVGVAIRQLLVARGYSR